MTQRNRAGGTILDDAMAARGWNPADDPGNIRIQYPKAKAEPICYCPVLPKNINGGMSPCIDLKGHRIACRVCGKTIPKSCGRASVRHLRRLLNSKLEHVDWDDARDAGFLL